jgi:hypothetical protein
MFSLHAHPIFWSLVFILAAYWIYRKWRPRRRPAPTPPAQEYGVPCYTLRGERVRSFPECFIANYLHVRGINYRYEHPLVVSLGNYDKTLFPDFYLPDFDIFLEYWGLIGVSSEYEQDMRWKMEKYHRRRIRFISIYPDNLPYPFNGSDFDKLFRYKFQKVTGIALQPVASDVLAPAIRIRPASRGRREAISAVEPRTSEAPASGETSQATPTVTIGTK